VSTQIFADVEADVLVTTRYRREGVQCDVPGMQSPIQCLLLTVQADYSADRRPEDAQALFDTLRLCVRQVDLRPDWQQMPPLRLGDFSANRYLSTSGECVCVPTQALRIIRRRSLFVHSLPFWSFSDDRIVEYDFKPVFQTKSRYQVVTVAETKDHGRVLLLDGQVNLAESDTLAYTHRLMGLPENLPLYSDAKVLILGGGDGALLKELLELPPPHSPAYVTLVDLDPAVVEACVKHMPSVCGPYLKQKNDKRHRVVIGDAVQFLESAAKSGEAFDVIFGDLTDVPVGADSLWSLLHTLLSSALRVLRPDCGRFLAHCNGASASAALARFEEALKELRVEKAGDIDKPQSRRVDVKRRDSFVPSFMERWVFYELSLVSS